MMKAQHVIWSNYDLDYERDWKGLLEEEYPDMTEEERELLMYEMNNSYLDDERCNLNIQLDCPIIVIADLGLWHGRASGYREIESGNVRDCLYSGRGQILPVSRGGLATKLPAFMAGKSGKEVRHNES